MRRKLTALLLAAALFALLAAGCANGAGDNSNGADTDGADTNGADTDGAGTGDTASGDGSDGSSEFVRFDYSEGIAENGHWEGVTALELVKLCDYEGIPIPETVHSISADSVQTRLDSLLSSFGTTQQVTDRPVVDGDTVNIDYVGSCDGTPFDGGSTGGAGTEVTIGVTSYIPGFLEQLVGHSPGESFDIDVTFPVVYPNNPDLSGKAAVFAITINYIEETVLPELTQEFISENFGQTRGWTNEEELRSGLYSELQAEAVDVYIQNYVMDECTVETLPEHLVTYQENSQLAFYEEYAAAYGVDIETLLSSYQSVSSAQELFDKYREQNEETARFYLIVQAIAEDSGFTVSDEEVSAYFTEYLDVDDYSDYASYYGMPYIRQSVLVHSTLLRLAQAAVYQ